MQQQINLFHPVFRRQPKVFSFETCVLICLATLLLLLLISGVYVWQKSQLQHHTQDLQEKHSQLVMQLERLTQELGHWQNEGSRQTQVQQLRTQLSAHRFLLQKLGIQPRKQKGFSGHFEGFSRQVLQGLWLTGFEVTDGGGALRVSGSTIESRLVADFIQRLSSEPVLQGMKFQLLSMFRENPRNNWLDFTLASGVGVVSKPGK